MCYEFLSRSSVNEKQFYSKGWCQPSIAVQVCIVRHTLNLFNILSIFHGDFYLTFTASFKVTKTYMKIKDYCELLPKCQMMTIKGSGTIARMWIFNGPFQQSVVNLIPSTRERQIVLFEETEISLENYLFYQTTEKNWGTLKISVW